MNKPIVVLTALEVEREAVLKHIDGRDLEKHSITKTDYIRGKYTSKGKTFDIVVGRTDQTNVNAAIETERALQHFNPEYVFFVGVAGGLKDVAVGDIVIGAEVYGYERGKSEEGNFKPRPKFGASTYELERMASAYAKSEDWIEKVKKLTDQQFAPTIKTLTGTIASGEKVDASTASEIHKFLIQNASHALAVEMEGLGFLEVCRMRPAVKSLLLRGISDLVKDKGIMDEKGSQPYASQNVSEFLFGIIEQLEISGSIPERTVENRLIEIMCKLYPGGLKDNGIWLAAGGNLSLVHLTQTGKGQWVEAIRLLKNGGGGNISLKSLIQAVYNEYPVEDVKAVLNIL